MLIKNTYRKSFAKCKDACIQAKRDKRGIQGKPKPVSMTQALGNRVDIR